MKVSPTAIDNIINSEYLSLSKSISDYASASHLNNIIQLKITKENPDIYLDVKKYIKHYTKSVDELQYGYDDIIFEKMSMHIGLLDHEKQIQLYDFASKQLRLNGFDDQVYLCEKKIHKLRISLIWKHLRYNNILNYFYLITTWSSFSILLSLLLSLFISSLVLAPASHPDFVCLNFTPKNFASNSYINLLLNIICLAFDADDNLKVFPTNFMGLLIICSGKILFYTIIINILIKKLSSKFDTSK